MMEIRARAITPASRFGVCRSNACERTAIDDDYCSRCREEINGEYIGVFAAIALVVGRRLQAWVWVSLFATLLALFFYYAWPSAYMAWEIWTRTGN